MRDGCRERKDLLRGGGSAGRSRGGRSDISGKNEGVESLLRLLAAAATAAAAAITVSSPASRSIFLTQSLQQQREQTAVVVMNQLCVNESAAEERGDQMRARGGRGRGEHVAVTPTFTAAVAVAAASTALLFHTLPRRKRVHHFLYYHPSVSLSLDIPHRYLPQKSQQEVTDSVSEDRQTQIA